MLQLHVVETSSKFQITSNEEETAFLEGQKRYEIMKRHLRHTENRMAATTSVANKDAAGNETYHHKYESAHNTKHKVNYANPLSTSE